MNGQDILLGLSHIDSKYIDEAEHEPSENRINRPLKKSLLIAAIISLMLLLLGCAWAILSLQNMTIDTLPFTDHRGEERHFISLQGYQGSKNYEAFQEWKTFCDSYDPDQKILRANDDFVCPDAYRSYACYSQEMADKLAEICDKYDLEPLGKPWFYQNSEHVFEAVGIRSVFSGKVHPLQASGYCYADGTFHLVGEIHMEEPWNDTFGFNLRSVQKTSFDGASSNLGDPESYDQWVYTRKDGTTVLLAYRDSGLIIVDKDDCFVAISAYGIPAKSEAIPSIPQDRTFMEAFCEAFDFGYQAQRVDPDQAYALQCAEDPHTYEQLINTMLASEERYPNLQYALIDINGDGQDELFLRSEEILHNYGFQVDENMFMAAIGEKDGNLVYFTGGGAMYLCEGDFIVMLSTFEGEEQNHSYCRFDTDYQEEQLDLIRPLDGKMYQDVMGNLIEISDEEAEAIVNKYSRIEIDFNPATEFQKN